MKSLRIDLFCEIVDNFGDAGIAWRLASQLADEKQANVTLWIDQPEIVERWQRERLTPIAVRLLADASRDYRARDALVAVLTTPVGPAVMARLREAGSVLMRYEHLTAEPWIDGFHGLPSPKHGLMEWFFYPGFTDQTGGLLRESAQLNRTTQYARNANQWLAAQGLAPAPDQSSICVFGYNGAPLQDFVAALLAQEQPVNLIFSEGVFQALGAPTSLAPHRIHRHPWLSQDAFDQLLASCDLNLVRGEDSWVRAHWTDRPFLWQPYRQDDHVHRHKLDAWLERIIGSDQSSAALAMTRLMQQLSPVRPAKDSTIRQQSMRTAVRDYLIHLEPIQQIHRRWRETLTCQPTAIDKLTTFIRDHLQ